jgi:H/ACA ribonucleoprotein complex subunit 4
MNDIEIRNLINRSVINLDKPSGISSQEVVVEIKKLFGLKKCGHTGTLDPKVTGVLVIALENATKAMPVLMGLNKEYEGLMYIHKDIDKETIEETISKYFIGEITQTPPVKSNVARKPRKKIVYSFKILSKKGKNVRFQTKVQAGTYIRKLCSDIGEKLGIKAHMKELRRTKVGHFSINDSHSIEEIKEAFESHKSRKDSYLKNLLISIEKAIPHVKKVYIIDSSVKFIQNGAPVLGSYIEKMQPDIRIKEHVGIFSSDNRLIAIGISKSDAEIMKYKSNQAVIKTDRVF